MESFGYFFVHLDQQLLLLSQLLVAIRDFSLHPLTEWFTNDCIGDVDEPLPGHFVHVSIFRQMLAYIRILSSLLQDVHNAQVLVLWHKEHLYVVTFNATLK